MSLDFKILEGKTLKYYNQMLFYRIEDSERKRGWDLYVSVYPNFDKKTFKPFEKFYEELKSPGKPRKIKTKESILEDAERIKEKHKRTRKPRETLKARR